MIAAAMLLGTSSAFAQVKIGSNPTSINAANNLEVEASTAGRKTSVDKTTGQVTIKDGTEGAGKILTSDATGGASWQSPTTIRVPETVWIGEQTGTYTITPFAGFDQLKDRIPLNARTGSLPGYNAATKKYTIQADGYYRINIGAHIVGTSTVSVPNDFASLYMGTYSVVNQYNNINAGTGPVLTVFWEAYMTAGTEVDVYVVLGSYTPGGSVQNLLVDRTFLSVTKLF